MSALEVQNLSKKFLLNKALDHVDIKFEKGKLIGLLGPNGSGKTTMMRIIAGLLQPSTGKVVFENNLRGAKLKEKVSFMPTESHLYPWMKIKEVVKFYSTFFEDFNSDQVYEYIKSLELDYNKTIKTLSTGQRGRLKVALALSRKAELYLIDEPLNGIDPISRDMILDMLAAQGGEDKCVVISSHLVHEFERIIDDVIFLKKGQVELHDEVEKLRSERGMSIHDLYKEIYRDA